MIPSEYQAYLQGKYNEVKVPLWNTPYEESRFWYERQRTLS